MATPPSRSLDSRKSVFSVMVELRILHYLRAADSAGVIALRLFSAVTSGDFRNQQLLLRRHSFSG